MSAPLFADPIQWLYAPFGRKRTFRQSRKGSIFCVSAADLLVSYQVVGESTPPARGAIRRLLFHS